MSRHRDQLGRALRAVKVTSPTSFTWFGNPSRPLPRDVLAAVTPSSARAYLIDSLQGELYRSFYIRGAPVPPDAGSRPPARPDEGFVEALSRANAGAGGWQPGWEVVSVRCDSAIVRRDWLAVRARVADCRAARGRPGAGEPVSVRRPKELRAASPGFYTALGDREPADTGAQVEVRVYFHVRAAGAAPLVAACTRQLNAAKVPFALKVVDSPAGFHRCDAAVLYLERDGFRHARRSLASIVAACSSHLRGPVPAFTLPLAHGVAVAERHAGLGGSFGSGRCRLVAEGVVEAHERSAAGLENRIEAVARRFADHGLRVHVPYLAPGSTSRYAL